MVQASQATRGNLNQVEREADLYSFNVPVSPPPLNFAR
jgi:hypothetical protein